jgi:RNA polymerase sigma-70 factor, ECF subfamily
LTPKNELADRLGVLRRFGLALARDDRFVCDERSAATLVDSLSKRAAIADRSGAKALDDDRRLRLFALFIRLYRRHVRMAAIDEGAQDVLSYGADPGGHGSPVERAIRGLPLELRESLLLVVLERFSHIDAARALDIPLATLIDRLARGRAMLEADLSERRAFVAGGLLDPAPSRGAPHLRLVK